MTKHQVPGTSTELMLPDGFVTASDNADAKQIAEYESTGRACEEYVYAFSIAGQKKPVTGPSITGISVLFDETFEAPLDVIETVMDRFPHSDKENPYMKEGAMVNRVAVRGKIPKSGGSATFAVVDQPEFMRYRDGSWHWDKHSIAKAVSMAQRNCMRKLLRVQGVVAFVAKHLKAAKHVKMLGMEDVRDPKGTRSALWIGNEKRLFALAGQCFDMGKDANRFAFKSYIVKVYFRPISEMNDETIKQAAEHLDKFIKDVGKEAFKVAVLGGGS